MKAAAMSLTSRQVLFEEMFVGTLIYTMVLGFFDDYTDVFVATSFSTVFLVALIMQVLTYLTFSLKRRVVRRFGRREGAGSTAGMVLSVWLIMFLSKFVFLWVLDGLFGSSMQISGFLGLIAIIVTVTALSALADTVFKRLGDGTVGPMPEREGPLLESR
jgi:hypothetical protein